MRGETVIARLPRRPRGDRRRDRRRRLAAHRRSRHVRRRRLPAHRRSHQGHVHRRRLQRVPGRDREPAAAPPADRAGRGDRRARRAPRRGRHGVRGAASPAPPVEPAEIIEWARGEMANFKVPRFVEFVDALPVNATGKVVKDELRAPVPSTRSRDETTEERDGAGPGRRGRLHVAERRAAADRQPLRARAASSRSPRRSRARGARRPRWTSTCSPRRGRLWAWTTQDFPPPSPPYAGPTGEDFVPFGVGYVELPAR